MIAGQQKPPSEKIDTRVIEKKFFIESDCLSHKAFLFPCDKTYCIPVYFLPKETKTANAYRHAVCFHVRCYFSVGIFLQGTLEEKPERARSGRKRLEEENPA